MSLRAAALIALAASLVLSACSRNAAEDALRQPLPPGGRIEIKSEQLPLNPSNPAQDRIGNFEYAGGVTLTSKQTSRLHGLSDLDVQEDGTLIAVSDEGDLLRAHVDLILGTRAPLPIRKIGYVEGLSNASITALTDLNGKPLQGKDNRDSEGEALLPSGDLLISFERQDRIWLYPKDGGHPRAVPSPAVKFPYNEGMEALAPDPDRGPDAYFTGGETTGRTWTCTLAAPCVEGPRVPLDVGFGLVAARRLGGGRTAWLLRAFNPITRSVIDLRITDAAGQVIDQMELRGPLTVDNFEGLGVVPQSGGRTRFYLISDDNFSSGQRTLLLAFDWTPPTKAK